MKRILALLLVVVFTVVPLAGCGRDTTDTAPQTEKAPEGIKTGLGIVTSIAKSKDAGTQDGLAQADSTIVAVTVDSNGVITDSMIDVAQTKVNFNTSGEITTPLDATFKTKNELGPDYGMGKVSPIGKEWNEQAAAFAQYVIGKTADEVENIAVTEDGYPAESDLTSSVTIRVTDFITGVQKAVANARDLGASKGDKLTIATVTSIGKSKNATADADGLAEISSTYVAMTQDADGKITSAILDASQARVTFDTNGKITTDLTVAPQTKNEQKEAYGMGKVSPIGKEWYEQAASFADYVTGKTADEVEKMAVTEDGRPAESDLTSSVTIRVTDFIDVIAKAAE